MELIDEVETMDGSRELIEELKRRGHTVVLASSAKQDEVDHYLELLGARELADAWTTSADVEATKPAPDLVSAALERAGGSSDDAVMVGDTPWDVEAARRAGVGDAGGPDRRLLRAGAARSRSGRGVRVRRRTVRSARSHAAGLSATDGVSAYSRLSQRDAEPQPADRRRGDDPARSTAVTPPNTTFEISTRIAGQAHRQAIAMIAQAVADPHQVALLALAEQHAVVDHRRDQQHRRGRHAHQRDEVDGAIKRRHLDQRVLNGTISRNPSSTWIAGAGDAQLRHQLGWLRSRRSVGSSSRTGERSPRSVCSARSWSGSICVLVAIAVRLPVLLAIPEVTQGKRDGWSVWSARNPG